MEEKEVGSKVKIVGMDHVPRPATQYQEYRLPR